MDPLTIMTLVGQAISLINNPAVQSLVQKGFSGITLSSLQGAIPSLVPGLEALGATLFPKADSTIHAVLGGVAAITSGSPTKALQTELNSYLAGSAGFVPLVVDGKYGPATFAAVQKAQTKLGIKPDGWFGQVSSAALAKALGK